MGKLYYKSDLPPCPDPDKYIAARYGDKWGWKKKRGTVKPVKLNESFQRNSNNMAVTSPAAKELIQKLSPFLLNLGNDRRLARLGGLLKKGLNKTGNLDYSSLYGFEFQRKYPLKAMLTASYKLELVNDHARFSGELREFYVRAQNKLVTQFFLELILLQGEMMTQNRVRVESDVSDLLDFNKEFSKEVLLSVLLPENLPWMLVLRLSCLEGADRAWHPKHHRLRVIAAGRGRIIEVGEQREQKTLG